MHYIPCFNARNKETNKWKRMQNSCNDCASKQKKNGKIVLWIWPTQRSNSFMQDFIWFFASSVCIVRAANQSVLSRFLVPFWEKIFWQDEPILLTKCIAIAKASYHNRSSLYLVWAGMSKMGIIITMQKKILKGIFFNKWKQWNSRLLCTM